MYVCRTKFTAQFIHLRTIGHRWFVWQGATSIITITLSQSTSCTTLTSALLTVSAVTLMLRLYAMYQLNKAVLAMMIVTFVASLGASAGVLIVNLLHVNGTRLQLLRVHLQGADAARYAQQTRT